VGKGEFNIPHSIRIDPVGNAWTVDAGSSAVIGYSPFGEKLMTITVFKDHDGSQPNICAIDTSCLQMTTLVKIVS
jgi:hypothetical protein